MSRILCLAIFFGLSIIILIAGYIMDRKTNKEFEKLIKQQKRENLISLQILEKEQEKEFKKGLIKDEYKKNSNARSKK